ncbi:unnamed protein product, partial [Staurois parvus]
QPSSSSLTSPSFSLLSHHHTPATEQVPTLLRESSPLPSLFGGLAKVPQKCSQPLLRSTHCLQGPPLKASEQGEIPEGLASRFSQS